jgi:hypothetical protein
VASHTDRDETPSFEEAEALISKIEASLEWMRRSKSPETVRLMAELQRTLDDIRAELAGATASRRA